MSTDDVKKLTLQISENVTKIVLATLQRTVAELVTEAISDAVPVAVKRMVDMQLPGKLLPMLTEAIKPMGEIMEKLDARVTKLEKKGPDHSPTASTTKEIPKADNVEIKFIDALKKDPPKSRQQRRFSGKKVTGRGCNIGIKKTFHLVIRKIPVGDTYDEKWLKKSILEKIPDDAEIRDVQKLVSKDPARIERTHTQTYKIAIKYPGSAADLYKAEFYPQNTEIKRYRFFKNLV